MRPPLFCTWCRLLFVQGSWNFERMIGVGLAYALEPILAKLPEGKSSVRYRAALGRATSFFNTHPYLAGIAAGAVGRSEHEAAAEAQVQRLKSALIGPLGSIGDKLIWAGALPATAGLGLAAAALFRPWVGALVFLGLFNAVHLPLRWWALSAGWSRGAQVAQSLKSRGLQQSLRISAPLAVLSLGFCLPLLAAWFLEDVSREARFGVAAVAAGVIAARWLVSSLSAHRLGLIVGLLAMVLGLVWRW